MFQRGISAVKFYPQDVVIDLTMTTIGRHNSPPPKKMDTAEMPLRYIWGAMSCLPLKISLKFLSWERYNIPARKVMNQNQPISIVIDEMARRIKEFTHPSKIILFGSCARETAVPGSDRELLLRQMEVSIRWGQWEKDKTQGRRGEPPI